MTAFPAGLPRGLLLLAWVFIILAAGFAGYQQLFSTFSPYDDEGYVMISLQSFLDGKPLYDETYTQYGPAYYLFSGVLHRGLSLPITHEVARWKTLFVWIGTALLSAALVFRTTRTHVLALGAFAAVFLHLDKLPMEPGHPQELCALFTAGVLVVATYWSESTRTGNVVLAVILGFLGGLAAMTKINVGILLSLAAFLPLLMLTRPTAVRNTLLAGVALGSLLLPLALFRDPLLDWHASPLPLVTVFALLGIFLAWRFRGNDDSKSPWYAPAGFLAAFTITTGIVAGIAWWSGTTVSGLYEGLIGQHAGFEDRFFHAPPVTPLAVPVGFGLVLLAAGPGLPEAQRRRYLGWCRMAAIAICAACGLAYWLQSTAPPVHGMQPRGGTWLLLSYAPALMWLLVLPAAKRGACSQFAARVVLACVAVLMPLQIYPTPGTQVAVGTFPLLLGCLLLAHECLAAWQHRASSKVAQWAPHVAIAMLSLFAVTMVTRDISFFRYRSGLTPLALPGTGGLKLPEETVRQYRKTVKLLEDHAGTVAFADHGYNSVYLWSGVDPPTSLNTTFGRILLSPKQQARIVLALKGHEKVAVIREASGMILPRGPLVEFVEKEFELLRTVGTWQLWVRRPEAN